MNINTYVLDLVGEVCPSPLLRTQDIFTQLRAETQLVVETDFARAVRNISHWCGREGFHCRIEDLPRGTWRIIIQRSPFAD
ncbi:MAG TPA: sulfurtransferase TusA family protein [Symbiobacteriaceae bacterium]|jgi:TusA-related sulfurtransferase